MLSPPHFLVQLCWFNAHGTFRPTSLPVSRPGPLPGVPSPRFCVLDPLSLKGDASSPTKLFISSPELSQETLLAPASPPGITRCGQGQAPSLGSEGAGSGLPAGFGAARPAPILHTASPSL